MAYRKHTPASRKYKKSHSHDHNSQQEPPISEEKVLPPVESASVNEKKKSQPFGFLTSLFGSEERAERSGNPIFTIMDHDIFLDDLLLAGLIILLLTDNDGDEILLIVLGYLLLDIF